jgi:hypothetical protein
MGLVARKRSFRTSRPSFEGEGGIVLQFAKASGKFVGVSRRLTAATPSLALNGGLTGT